MKYKNPEGKVYDNLVAAAFSYCGERECHRCQLHWAAGPENCMSFLHREPEEVIGILNLMPIGD